MGTDHSRIPRRSFLGLLLAKPVALTAAPSICLHPARFAVAIVGWNPGLNDLLSEMVRHTIRQEVKITEHTFVEPLLDQAGAVGRSAFDLLIVFFNPYLAASQDWRPPPGPADRHLLPRLRRRCGRTPLVIHNGWAGYTTDEFRRAGAGGVLPMPFSLAEFAQALNACLANNEAGRPERFF